MLNPISIAHISVPARDPRRVAELLAPVIDGRIFDFPVVPGAYIVVARDGSGTAIEVLPEGARQQPGRGEPDPDAPGEGPGPQPWEVQIPSDGPSPGPVAFHAAITSPLSAEALLEIGRRAGWRAVRCERAGVFGVVELWIDDRFLLELLPPEEARRYRDFMRPEGCGEVFGPPRDEPRAAA